MVKGRASWRPMPRHRICTREFVKLVPQGRCQRHQTLPPQATPEQAQPRCAWDCPAWPGEGGGAVVPTWPRAEAASSCWQQLTTHPSTTRVAPRSAGLRGISGTKHLGGPPTDSRRCHRLLACVHRQVGDTVSQHRVTRTHDYMLASLPHLFGEELGPLGHKSATDQCHVALSQF